jgi:hypothetical protein
VPEKRTHREAVDAPDVAERGSDGGSVPTSIIRLVGSMKYSSTARGPSTPKVSPSYFPLIYVIDLLIRPLNLLYVFYCSASFFPFILHSYCYTAHVHGIVIPTE